MYLLNTLKCMNGASHVRVKGKERVLLASATQAPAKYGLSWEGERMGATVLYP